MLVCGRTLGASAEPREASTRRWTAVALPPSAVLGGQRLAGARPGAVGGPARSASRPKGRSIHQDDASGRIAALSDENLTTQAHCAGHGLIATDGTHGDAHHVAGSQGGRPEHRPL